MTERPYHLILVCGREQVTCKVRDTAETTGASLLCVDITPPDTHKNRQGYLRDATLVMEAGDSSTEYNLSGFRDRDDLYSAASRYITRYVREHFLSYEHERENREIFNVLDGCQIGIAVFFGREIRKINQHLAELLGYSEGAARSMELPDLFCSPAEYMEFSRTIFRGKKDAGWHCASHNLATKDGKGVFCTIRVRRLDGFDPMKGHLMIVERTGARDRERDDEGQVFPSDWVRSGSFEEVIARVPGIVITTDDDRNDYPCKPPCLGSIRLPGR